MSLTIVGLPPAFTGMSPGAVYWLACSDLDQADLLGRVVLERAGAAALAVGIGRSPQPMLDGVPSGYGPPLCKLYQARGVPVRAVAALPADLRRIGGRAPALCVVQLPSDCVDAMSSPELANWCQRLQQACQHRGHLLVLVCHGEVATLVPRLMPMNRQCAGVAQLYAQRGALHYLVHYWSNALGVVAQREFALESDHRGLRLDSTEAELVPDQDGSDREVYLADSAVLEGAPRLSPAWRLYEGWSALAAAAARASQASVLLAVADNAEVGPLATWLHQLRRERGDGLKLVVREMKPCLRYADESLLLRCGASLVVPAGVPLARFLTLLDSVQGQRWQGRLPEDPRRLIGLHKPPEQSGVLTPGRFRQIVAGRLTQSQSAIESALLALQPLRGLEPRQLLRQLRVRRRGDLACVQGGQIWLFLFACRADGIEQALGNLFQMPWRELLVGYERLAGYDLETMVDVAAEPEDAPQEVVPAQTQSLPRSDRPAPTGLRPRRLRWEEVA